jgi:hypothetical protein
MSGLALVSCYYWWSRVRPQVARVLDAGAVAALKAMLVSGAEEPNGVHNAVAALGLICAVPEGRDAAFAEGVPVALETAFKTASPGARGEIAFAVSKMCVRGARVRGALVRACACDAVRSARGACGCENAAYVRARRVFSTRHTFAKIFRIFER